MRRVNFSQEKLSPLCYKTRLRLRSEQVWEIILAPEKELASIDVLVKHITHQALGNASVDSIGPMRDIRILWGNRSKTRDEYYNSPLKEILQGQTKNKRKMKQLHDKTGCGGAMWLWGHTFRCMSKNLSFHSFSFFMMYCMCFVSGTYCTVCIGVIHPGLAYLSWPLSIS